MEITIDIQCETVGEFTAHLYKIIRQTKSKAKKLKLNPAYDALPYPNNHDGADMDLYDENCYGEHAVFIKEDDI